MTEFEVVTSDTSSIIADFAINQPSDLNTIEKGTTATYTFGNVQSKLVIDAGDTYTIGTNETEQWDIVVVRGTLVVNGVIQIDSLEIDGGTVDIDSERFDLGGVTIPDGTTRYESPVIVPSGETLEIDGVLETQDIVIDGTVTGEGELKVTDDGRPPSTGVLDVNEKYAFGLDDVNKYSPYTNDYTITETLNSTQKYIERVDPTAPIDTLLVGIEPDTELSDNEIRGYWGLLRNVTDERNTALSNSRVTLEIDVLAPFENYADHTAVQQTLEL
jgi:hypothetical protein